MLGNEVTPGRRQSKLPILSRNVNKKSLEIEFSIDICRTGGKWQSKTLFLSIFDPHSSIVDSIFDCHLPGVELLRLIFFALFLLLLFLLPLLLFLPAQILSVQDLGNLTGRIVLKFGDMVDMDVKLCNKVLKFKMSDSKAAPWPKQSKFCPAKISETTRQIVLKFGDRVDRNVKLCNRVLKFKT